MNSLLVSMLVLGLSGMNLNVSMLAEQLSNSRFEVGFDINRFEDGDLRGHPDITHAPPAHYDGGWFRSRDSSSVRYFPPSIYNRSHQLQISCLGLPSPYHVLRWAGFTHEQLSYAHAKHISIHGDHDIYEIKTSTRHYTVTLSKFEQFLSHESYGCNWHGYDFVTIRWE